MKPNAALLTLVTLLVLTPLLCLANPDRPQQSCRIRQGVRSGDIKPVEVRPLTTEQLSPRNMVEDFRSDGTPVSEEKAKPSRREAKMNHDIYHHP